MNKTKTIFKKLFFSYVFIIFSSFLLFGLIFIYLFHIHLYNKFEEIYVHHYQQVEKQWDASTRFQWNEEETYAAFEPLLHQQNVKMFIFDSDGDVVLAPNESEVFQNQVDPSFLQQAANDGLISKGGRVDGHLTYLIASPLPLNDHNQQHGIMVMMFHDFNHEYNQMVLMILIAFTIIIAIAATVLWFTSKKMTRPLREMNRVAMNYAKGEFSHSVQVYSSDEIGQLGKTLNHMAAELDQLEESRKDFIANVSHDLRTPLTSIKGFLIALLDGTIPESRRDDFYLLMKDETERMIKLVNDTLDMSRLEAGQITLHPETYNVTKQLQIMAVKLEPHLMDKGMTIDIIPDDEEIFVYADRGRIEQVLINLLQNAIQVSPDHSDIKIYLEKQDDRVVISIQDQGAGISEEQLPHIWKRFYKTDKARTNKAGTGIGLSIVKSIIDLHETNIEVKSREGEGAIFSFTLRSGPSLK